MYLMKIQINVCLKNSDLYLMKVHIRFSYSKKKKNSNLYLMKIQIKFSCLEKKFRSVFNENTNLFLFHKNFQICI